MVAARYNHRTIDSGGCVISTRGSFLLDRGVRSVCGVGLSSEVRLKVSGQGRIGQFSVGVVYDR